MKAAAKVPRRPSAIIGKNQQLWALGTTHIEMEDADTVQTKIARLDSEFDLVLIAEYFDESLVLLAEILCWDLSDVRSGYQTIAFSTSVRTESGCHTIPPVDI